MGYVELKYKPKQDDVVCLFYVEPAGISLKKAAEHVAAESSIGTWTDVKTLSESIKKRLKARVFSIDVRKKIIKIAYPIELFELGNVPQLLSSIAGNIFGMKAVKNLRLLDVRLPQEYIKHFSGPQFGVHGIRRLLNISKRPLLGTIIKPKLGLNEKHHAKTAYHAWIGGCDIVKDDENLTNMRFNKFADRVIETLSMRDKAQDETGEIKVYMPNVTAETIQMLERVEFVKQQGGKYVMVDIITVGFSALQTLRKATGNYKLVLHAHRAMHAAMTRNKKHGVSMLTIAKLCRLIGVDQLHIGTIIGKMEGSNEVLAIHNELQEAIIKQVVVKEKNYTYSLLEQKWLLKPVFSVCSGGLCPLHVPKLMQLFGNNIIIQMGGGIHGHPKGTIAGAKAARQAIDAVMQGTKIKQYARTHKELGLALKKWQTKVRLK